MGYKTLEEWEKDLSVFRANPEDLQLLKSIIYRVNHTNPTLKDKIQLTLKDAVKWNDPIYSFDEITKDLTRAEEQVLYINTKEDPWFSA